jgi:hypothetical protein
MRKTGRSAAFAMVPVIVIVIVIDMPPSTM